MAQMAVRGVEWRVETDGAGPALLLLHGFTGSGRSWAPFAPALSHDRFVIRPDLPGHGGTRAPAPARCRMEEVVADLLELLDRLGVDRFDLLGYSMGGRVALHLMDAAPERVRRAVLESTSFGIQDPEEREARRRSDRALADRIEGRGVPDFVDRWEALPLFETQRTLPADVRARLRSERLQNTAAGLANSLRGMGAGEQACLLERLPRMAMPVLIIAGARDAKYVKVGETLHKRLPASTLVVVPGAGHNVHLERPEAFLKAVRGFLIDGEHAAFRQPSTH